MSQINWARLQAERPDLKSVWSRLEDWLGQHPDVPFLEARRLSRDLYPIPVWDLVQALGELVDSGTVVESYRVATPKGDLLDDEYYDPEEIPPELPTRLHDEWFAVDDELIVPIYRIQDARTS